MKNRKHFRKTQNWLDTNPKNILHFIPRSSILKKCIWSPPSYTETKLIVNSPKEYEFTVTRAVMLKYRKTYNWVPLYMVNVLPRNTFEDIYKIREIHFISVIIETTVVKISGIIQRFVNLHLST